MQKTLIGLAIVAVTCSQMLLGTSPANAQGLKIEKVGPIKPVGPIDPVGQLDPITDPGTGRKSADMVYLSCWTPNIGQKDQQWYCTERYEQNSRLVYEFTNYKLMQYPPEKGGAAFAKEVFKSDWDDPTSRKKIMDRIARDVIPGYVDKKTGHRRDFILPKWVDVKPVLSESRQKAYKDGKLSPQDAVTATFVGTSWDLTINNAGTVNVLFQVEGSLTWENVSASGLNRAAGSGTWNVSGDDFTASMGIATYKSL